MTIPTLGHPAYPPPTNAMTPRPLTDVKLVEIHHTGGPTSQTALEIDAEERDPSAASRGGPWSMIPYEFVAYNDERVDTPDQGRPIDYESGATFGDNMDSVAIVCVGNFQSDDAGFTGPPSDALIETVIQINVMLHRQILTITGTEGHRDSAVRHGYSTACPGDTLEAKLDYIRAETFRRLK